jgi:AraC-like DNA-binding protein/mannose-6-phosphate isomerase-like protein (cupin superfamily)
MSSKTDIKVYDTRTFTGKFMPDKGLQSLLREGQDKFFIVRLEDMYKHVHRPVPPSRSFTYTCFYLTHGEATMNIGSEKFTVYKGEMLFVPAGQIFSFEAFDATDKKKKNKGYLCNFHADVLVVTGNKHVVLKEFNFLQVWGYPALHLDKQTSGFILQLLQRIYLEFSENGLKNINIIRSYFLTLLHEANRVYKPGEKTSTQREELSNKFRELVFTSSRKYHAVSDYASLLSVSPNHLNKVVKAATGKSPGKWIDEAILLEAKVLLAQNELSISEVANAVGFEDQSYFTRLFKKHTGITPSEYRIEKS